MFRCSLGFSMMKDPDTTEEVQTAHAIMHMFRYSYRDRWVPQKSINQKDRLWTKVFNDLVKKGLIERKRTLSGYSYRWAGRFP